MVARHFGMEAGEPQELSLSSDMADKGPQWERIAEKHGLSQSATWEQLGTWTSAVSVSCLDFAGRHPFPKSAIIFRRGQTAGAMLSAISLNYLR